jgi:hypothetical protein
MQIHRTFRWAIFSAIFVFVFSSIHGSASQAAPISLSSLRDLASTVPNTDNVIRVTDYYEGTPRVPVLSLPLSIQQRYAATGTIQCNGWEGSAQLTIKNNLITTVAHVLHDPDTCVERAKRNQCVFKITSHGRIRSIRIKQLLISS